MKIAVASRVYNVLFLCTGNSARSIMAECAIKRWGKGKFSGFSAGSHPKGEIHPLTVELLNELNYATKDLRSKSWDGFAAPASPHLDFVFTVCDQAAAEHCPVWPGQPITAHWGVPDPVAFTGTEDEKRRFFLRIYYELENRIKIFTSLRIDALDRFALQQRVTEIGRTKLPDGWER
jgi:protein-tyrosine-phosphatase